MTASKNATRKRPVSSAIDATELSPPARFIKTQQYKRFAEFCTDCTHDRYIGICSGPPGVGKTLAARFYADWDRQQDARIHQLEEPPAFLRHCRTVFYTPSLMNTPYQVDWDLKELRRRQTLTVRSAAASAGYRGSLEDDHTELIIVDEADRLRVSSLEQLRDIYDRTGIAIVLIGMPGLARKLTRFPQLYSRVGFVHEFKTLSVAEVKAMLTSSEMAHQIFHMEPHQVLNDEALAAIARATNGNFRLMQRLSSQIQRILKVNNLRHVSKDVVEAARQNLLLGSR